MSTQPPISQTSENLSAASSTAVFDFVTYTMELLTSERDLHGMMDQILGRMREKLRAEAASLFMLSKDKESLEVTVCHGPVDITGLRLPATAGIVGECLKLKDVIAVKDASTDTRFNQSVDHETGFITHSILSVPLVVRDEPLGAVQFINKLCDTHLFDDADIRTVQVIAAAGAMALHSAQLTHMVLQQERTNRDIAQAAEVQKGLLPANRGPDFPIAGASYPATSMSGDFYDFFQRPDGKWCFAIGDVSGKGIRAAMIMSKTAGLFRSMGKTAPSPGILLQQINEELVETATMGLFVTMTVGFYDAETHEIDISNAGHEPSLIVYPNGYCIDVPADSPPLGILPMPESPQDQTLALGDGTLYLITDGVTEGVMANGEWMGRGTFTNMAYIANDLDLTHRMVHMAEPITFDLGQLRDDVTLLAVSGRPQHIQPPDAPTGAPILQLAVPSDASSLRHVREKTRDMLQRCGFEPTQGYDYVGAVDEACQNIVRHAYPYDALYPHILILVWQVETTLVTYILDKAPPLDTTYLVPRDLDEIKPGGLGLHIIQSAMDDVRYVTPPDGYGNCLRLERKFALIRQDVVTEDEGHAV